jgi:hypothetical protein
MEYNQKVDATKEVQALIEKAAKAADSNDALKFSQAAQNAANAMERIELLVREKT